MEVLFQVVELFCLFVTLCLHKFPISYVCDRYKMKITLVLQWTLDSKKKKKIKKYQKSKNNNKTTNHPTNKKQTRVKAVIYMWWQHLNCVCILIKHESGCKWGAMLRKTWEEAEYCEKQMHGSFCILALCYSEWCWVLLFLHLHRLITCEECLMYLSTWNK